ncbi:UNVERIFIED_ORG: putative DNA repair protein MutK [Arthrobacter sp. UYEF2]
MITVLVYGAVALIVKMDDVGLHLTTKEPRVRSDREVLRECVRREIMVT